MTIEDAKKCGFASGVIDDLSVHCPYSTLKRKADKLDNESDSVSNGCTWSGPQKDLQNHLSMTCSDVEVECPWKPVCGFKCSRGNMNAHLQLVDAHKEMAIATAKELSDLKENLKRSIFFPDGSVYEGMMEGFVFHGKGTLRYGNGDIFTGTFSNGKILKGKYTLATGEFYIGRFKNGLRNDRRGELYYVNGDRYEGEFLNGSITGEGYLFLANYSHYHGRFENGIFEGEGLYFSHENETRIYGTWTNGRIASGIIYDRDDNKYSGDISDMKPHGKGRMEFSPRDPGNRTFYEGNFLNGVFHGSGELGYKDKEPVHRMFDHGSEVVDLTINLDNSINSGEDDL